MADLRNKSSDIDRTLKIQGPEPLFSQHKWKNIDLYRALRVVEGAKDGSLSGGVDTKTQNTGHINSRREMGRFLNGAGRLRTRVEAVPLNPCSCKSRKAGGRKNETPPTEKKSRRLFGCRCLCRQRPDGTRRFE